MLLGKIAADCTGKIIWPTKNGSSAQYLKYCSTDNVFTCENNIYFILTPIFLQAQLFSTYMIFWCFDSKTLNQSFFFFSIWVFFHKHSRFTGKQGKGEGIYLTPLYHFHPLHRHLDISRAITAESSPLHIADSRTRTGKPLVSERKSLTTKLFKSVRMKNKSFVGKKRKICQTLQIHTRFIRLKFSVIWSIQHFESEFPDIFYAFSFSCVTVRFIIVG